MRFLVTAGSTREMIDAVRHWGNIFTGNTGFAIASELAAIGEVDLLTSNPLHLKESAKSAGDGHRINAQGFSSHADLREKLSNTMGGLVTYDAVIMSAAVSDYAPAGGFAVVSRKKLADGSGNEEWIVRDIQSDKIKSDHQDVAFLGLKTEKLVDLFRKGWNYQGLLIKFKLEVGISPQALIEIGQKSRRHSQADYLVANTLDMVSGPDAGAYLLGENIQEWVARGNLARRITQIVKNHPPKGSIV